jgi:hypothetical protein
MKRFIDALAVIVVVTAIMAFACFWVWYTIMIPEMLYFWAVLVMAGTIAWAIMRLARRNDK